MDSYDGREIRYHAPDMEIQTTHVRMSESIAITRSVRMNLEQGLHLRVCSQVLAIVNDFDGTVTIHNGDRSADAKSMFDLVQLSVFPGNEVLIEAHGCNAEKIVENLEELFSLTHLPD